MVSWVAKRLELPEYPEVALTFPRPWRWVESGGGTKKKKKKAPGAVTRVFVFVFCFFGGCVNC